MEVVYWCSPADGKPELVEHFDNLYDVIGGFHYGMKLYGPKDYGRSVADFGSGQRHIWG